MSEVKFQPCKQCIEALRYKLFHIKTECGMIPFSVAKKYALQYLFDLYTDFTLKYIHEHKSDFNIEHVIPANIIAPRPDEINKLYVNKEAFHDLHVLFPTLKDINTIRANYVYGTVAKTRDEILRDIKNKYDEYILINDDTYIGSKHLFKELDQLHEITESGLKQLPGDMDIYVDKKQYCKMGQCVFQPPERYSGEIARIVFYFYLMYAYDFSKRPYQNIGFYPWFANVANDTCYGFDFRKWKIFFFDHLQEYYNWAKNDPIIQQEVERNKRIIQLIQVPNIFTGHYNENDEYITGDFSIIEELFFGKAHDHNKYINMKIKYDNSKCKQMPLLIEDFVFQKMKNDPQCFDKIVQENKNAYEQQFTINSKIKKQYKFVK